MKHGKTSLLKFLDNTLGPLLCRVLGQVHFRLKPDHYPTPLDIHSVRRILIIRPGGIGDMVVLLPMLTHLSSQLPHAHLTIVCERRNRAVLGLAQFKGDTLTYDSLSTSFIQKLTRNGFDMVIDTEQFHHFSAVFALLSRAPIRIGFNINPRRNPLYSHLVSYSPNQSEVEQFMSLLHPLPIAKGVRGLPGVLDSFASSLPDGFRQALQSSGQKRYVAIHAGSSSPYKQWDSSKFVELCLSLWKDLHIQPVLVGGKDDQECARQIAEGFNAHGAKMVSLVGSLSLEQTTSVLQHAAAFLGLDSGLAHISVALNRPSVVLFGPTDPNKWGTDGGHNKVIYKAVPCSPCAIFGYFRPCSTFACMKLITTGEVVSALKKVL